MFTNHLNYYQPNHHKSSMKEKEFLAYEKGFEDGYAMARRLYEPYCVEVTTKSGLTVKKLLKSTPPQA